MEHLYCSSDLLGSERHAQLRIAGAPRKPEPIVSQVSMESGNMWHDRVSKTLFRRGLPVMCEVRITDFLPEGWGGRVDFLCWDKDKRAFSLVDLKTTKGEGIKWIRNKPKLEHIWQLSAYYHALKEARFPLLDTFTLFYLPMTNIMGESPEPILIDWTPVPKETIWKVMEERWQNVKAYLVTVPVESTKDSFVTSELADPISRIQKVFKNGNKWDVRLVPHWSTMFCPYEDDLCDCNTQGQTKIGEFVDGSYKPRKGFEEILPRVRPRY